MTADLTQRMENLAQRFDDAAEETGRRASPGGDALHHALASVRIGMYREIAKMLREEARAEDGDEAGVQRVGGWLDGLETAALLADDAAAQYRERARVLPMRKLAKHIVVENAVLQGQVLVAEHIAAAIRARKVAT